MTGMHWIVGQQQSIVGTCDWCHFLPFSKRGMALATICLLTWLCRETVKPSRTHEHGKDRHDQLRMELHRPKGVKHEKSIGAPQVWWERLARNLSCTNPYTTCKELSQIATHNYIICPNMYVMTDMKRLICPTTGYTWIRLIIRESNQFTLLSFISKTKFRYFYPGGAHNVFFLFVCLFVLVLDWFVFRAGCFIFVSFFAMR